MKSRVQLFLLLLMSGFIGMGLGYSAKPDVKSTQLAKKSAHAAKMKFLADKLKAGGFIVLFRHSLREKTEDVWGSRHVGFPALLDLDLKGECAPGSELTEAGKLESQTIAQTIKKTGIPVGEVLVSPTCRTLQMAEILFGKNFKVDQDLIYIYMREVRSHKKHNEALMKLLTEPTQKGKNRFLISHNNVLREATIGIRVNLKQSDAAVFQSNPNNELIYLGIIGKDDWAALSPN